MIARGRRWVVLLVWAIACASVGDVSAFADERDEVRYERMDLEAGSLHPFPRNAFTVAPGIGDSLLLFGGVYEYFKSDTPLYKHFGDLWRFSWDGNRARWELVHGCDPDEPMCLGGPCDPTGDPGCDQRLTSPSVRSFHAMGMLDGGEEKRSLALFGGTYFTKTFQNVPKPDAFWLYDIQARVWENLTPLPGEGPGPRNGAVGVSHGSRFYVFGGVDAALQTFNDLWVFDLETRAWTLLSPHDPGVGPVPRHSAQGALVTVEGDTRLIVYGGETIEVTTFSFDIPSDTWEFDLATGEWRDLGPARKPTPTRNYAVGVTNAGGDLFVLQGGDVEGGASGCGALFFEDPTNEVWVYDRSANEWEERLLTGAVIPPGAKRHGGVQVGDHSYVMGGWEFSCDGSGAGPGQVFNTDVYRFKNP